MNGVCVGVSKMGGGRLGSVLNNVHIQGFQPIS